MPTIETIGSYRIELHTGREGRTPHVHICHEGKDVLVNLYLLTVYGEVHFRVPRKVMEYLESEQMTLIETWEQYHGGR